MDYAQALIDTAEELDEYGEFNDGTDTYLQKLMLRWAKEVYRRHPWRFRITSTTLTPVAGTRGPYDLPADFALEVREERFSQAFGLDTLILPETPDGDYNRLRPVVVDRKNLKAYFTYTPSENDASVTFYYIKRLTAITDLSDWPQDMDDIIIQGTKAKALKNSPDNLNAGLEAQNEAQRLLKEYWRRERQGHTLQEERVLRDVYGYPLAPDLENNEWV